MTTAELVIHSHAMDELLAQLRQAEQERDEAKRHLQTIISAYEQDEDARMEDAIHTADFWLKGGI
jgi:F0F1-type ATP synthase membrane subunit b/b'